MRLYYDELTQKKITHKYPIFTVRHFGLWSLRFLRLHTVLTLRIYKFSLPFQTTFSFKKKIKKLSTNKSGFPLKIHINCPCFTL